MVSSARSDDEKGYLDGEAAPVEHGFKCRDTVLREGHAGRRKDVTELGIK